LEALLNSRLGNAVFSWSGVNPRVPFFAIGNNEQRPIHSQLRISAPTRYLGKRVLLVEDNEDNRTVYRTILNLYGYIVLEARNGEDGVRMASEDHPDLILMDISIPLIDGWEATRIIKNDAATCDIPVVALTAHALATDRAKAHECGCDGYLAKPCEPRRVAAEVERLAGLSFIRGIEWIPEGSTPVSLISSET
jgi:two-component system, cell cycle response regulator DivK